MLPECREWPFLSKLFPSHWLLIKSFDSTKYEIFSVIYLMTYRTWQRRLQLWLEVMWEDLYILSADISLN
jgi:hypothetical protein